VELTNIVRREAMRGAYQEGVIAATFAGFPQVPPLQVGVRSWCREVVVPNMRRFVALWSALLVALGSSGCTLIGAALGSTSPRMGAMPMAYQFREGERVTVRTNAGRETAGTFLSQDEQQIVLHVWRPSVAGTTSPTREDVIVMRSAIAAIQVRRGNHAYTGALVGLAVDAIVIVTLVILSSRFADGFDDSDNHH
jgi:hypothetical protein